MSNFWQQFKKPILALAPMCGVTDLPFRLICKELGADVVYTEMTMVQSLSRKNPAALRLVELDPAEQPVIIQLGGREPEHFRSAAKIARELGAAGIDINMGCPAKKIAGNGSGVSLLRDLELARQIIEATLEGAGSLHQDQDQHQAPRQGTHSVEPRSLALHQRPAHRRCHDPRSQLRSPLV